MEEKSDKQISNNELVNAANFALQKFLLRAGVVAQEGKILENELHNLKTRVQLKKINTIIQKH
jgi:hypothetical protein